MWRAPTCRIKELQNDLLDGIIKRDGFAYAQMLLLQLRKKATLMTFVPCLKPAFDVSTIKADLTFSRQSTIFSSRQNVYF